ncbi:MAG TPA: alpha/beta hydrolase [Actinophytocola sp.]|jgi:pimeloyl-ACP methyl ester carboxylesterase|nr:alpha/beta hydrolase [Actinophytocola sp.]
MFVAVGGARLAVSTVGSPADPAVLLIMGSGASMDFWEPSFCAPLADAGRYVIRYDHRDTGESTSYPPGRPGYTSDDLFADPLGILDALGVERAHVAGMSMGGAIAQLLALRSPSRLRTLTLISTSSAPGDEDLPTGGVGAPPEPDWSSPDAVLEYQVAEYRAAAAATRPFDEAAVRALLAHALARTTSPESASKNHYALEGEDVRWRERLPEIAAPTLVLHGADDPLFPLPHGEALAREIPNARLVALPHTGHEFPRENYPLVLRELIAHTA